MWKGLNGGRYIKGQKRCQCCEIYIIRNVSVFCPWCGSRLRYKPRKGKLKLKFHQVKNNKEHAEMLVI